MINPESKFSMFQNIQVQVITWATLILTPLVYVFWDEYPQIHTNLTWVEWIVDLSWTVEICLNFITADANNRTFKTISYEYMKFWFWVDALATFPAIITL